MAAEFSRVSREQWEAVACADRDRSLTTVLEEGIEVGWLYTPSDALAPDPGGEVGADPFVRGTRLGTPWAIRQPSAAADRRLANREIRDDLAGGASEVMLFTGGQGEAVSAAPRSAFGGPGIPIGSARELREVLAGVDLGVVPVALAGAGDHTPVAELLVAEWRHGGCPRALLRGSLRLDPFGEAADQGSAGESLLLAGARAAVELLGAVVADFPQVQALAVDTTPYVEAGAGPVLELAAATATAIAYLRAGDEAGIDPATVAAGLEFTLVVGPDQFLEIAKLRAARRLWSSVLEQCGVAPESRRSLTYCRTSARMMSTLDPSVNMLRATTAAFAAATGGADGITVLPFDAPFAEPDPRSRSLGRRLARNTQLLLLQEASLGQVADPAAGSWYVEALTDQLARAAWQQLQQIERAGGIAVALSSGALARRTEAATAERQRALARRDRLMTGVNIFPLSRAEELEREAAPGRSAVACPVAPQAAGHETRLVPVRDGAQLEALRARAARLTAVRGSAPRILLACMGPLASHVEIVRWARSFFASGGIEVVSSGVQPDAAAQAALLRERGFAVAAVCPGRDADPDAQAELVAALHAAGAAVVYLAGVDAGTAAAVGADVGVRDGVDMVAVLGALLGRFEGSGS